MQEAIHVIGASGRSGAALCRALLADGKRVIPVVRSRARYAATRLPWSPAIADLTKPETLAGALLDATRIVSTAHARHARAVLEAAPPEAQFVFLGSTRKFTRWPDDHARGVIAGEAAFRASGRAGVMLHPTMIYGAQGEDNVRRLAALLRRLPVVPLPGGGRALVQPIHQDDVTAAIRAALEQGWTAPQTVVIAGARPMTYAEFVTAVGTAAGLAPPRIVSVPASLLLAAAPITRALPFLPRISRAEIRRLLEDKDFDTGPMLTTLGLRTVPLDEGLRRTFLSRSGS